MSKYVKRHISISDKRVNDAFDQVGRGRVSKFIEDCVLFYLDSAESCYVSADQVRGIVLDCLKDLPLVGESISNPNHLDNVDQLESDIDDILKL